MAKKPLKYCVVDAFTEVAFKGNPAAVCLLEEEKDQDWLQAVAREFNTPTIGYLTQLSTATADAPRFRLRWFTPVAEVKLCGHATLAASYFLFARGLVKSHVIEYSTLSGILLAKRVSDSVYSDSPNIQNGSVAVGFLIELDFPVVPITECDSSAELITTVSRSLNCASVIEIHKTTLEDDLFVVLASGEAVAEVQPLFSEVEKLPGRGVIITGRAPVDSGFDFFSRFFCPKMGVNEVPFEYYCRHLDNIDASQKPSHKGER